MDTMVPTSLVPEVERLLQVKFVQQHIAFLYLLISAVLNAHGLH